MSEVPVLPFLTADFSPRAGGIDFLGLRWVNLTMVGRELIPELNNVTTDMGTFILGGWIPWKFRAICEDGKGFTERNYRAFREKAEAAIALTYREESGIARPWGAVRNRVGITQDATLPKKLSFANVKRGPNNSIFAAAIYGPALNALGFVKAYHCVGKGDERVAIPVAGDADEVNRTFVALDASLQESRGYRKLASLDSPEFDWTDIRSLGEAGLDPAAFRGPLGKDLKPCFRAQLLPDDEHAPGFRRTETARLLLATLACRAGITSDEVRDAWYTGLFSDGKPIHIGPSRLEEHRKRWSWFMARQYQRYAIELFLWFFEDSLADGCRSVDDILERAISGAMKAGLAVEKPLGELLAHVAGSLKSKDDLVTSQAWNDCVHAGDDRFEFIEEPCDEGALAHGLHMIGCWYWRMCARLQEAGAGPFLSLGGADRMGMSWFMSWFVSAGEDLGGFQRFGTGGG